MSDVELRNLAKHVEAKKVANSYAAAQKGVPRRAECADSPGYDPFGVPPDAYALALRALREVAQERQR